MQLLIKIPNNNLLERKYIIKVLFFDFLGLEYNIIALSYLNHTELIMNNGKKIIIEDHFFSKFPKDLSYLNCINIPSVVSYFDNEFISKRLPIIYGRNFLQVSKEGIICGLDLLASSFFMLTRWEEYVNNKRDNHDRFRAIDSLAFKFDFLERPIVNEYLFFLKKIMLYLDDNLFFKERKPKTYISCDVDEPFDCTVRNFGNLFRVCSGDILKRKKISMAIKRIRRFIYNKQRNYKYDKKYTFDWYMSVCELNNIKASFYFIPDNSEEGNGCYSLHDANIKELLLLIDKRGHEIGVHGSYQTYKDFEKVSTQKDNLQETMIDLGIKQKIIGNRQHYLRWDSSITPSILNKALFEYDTTGGYADKAGFRYGVCYEFNMFDFLNRQELNIKQRPLIIMECSVIDKVYMGLGVGEKSFLKMRELKEQCYSYKGNFTLLWHNSYFKTKNHRILFQQIIEF